MILNRTMIRNTLCAATVAWTNGLLAADDVIIEEPVRRAFPANFANVTNNVDNWVYGSDAASARSRLENQITQKIRELDKRQHLTESMQETLKLAAHHDLVRLYAEVDTLKERLAAAPQDMMLMRTVASEAMNLRKKQQSLFDQGSFFAKTSKKLIADARQSPNGLDSDNPMMRRHAANVESAVDSLDQRVPLTRWQREALAKFLFKEIHPEGELIEYEDLIVKYRLSRLPRETIKIFCDDDQWPRVNQALNGFFALGPVLAHLGLINDDVAGRTNSLVSQVQPPQHFAGVKPANSPPHAENRALAHEETGRLRVRSQRSIPPERRTLLRRHRANLETAVQTVARQVDLNKAQRSALVELLFLEVDVPKVVGNYDDLVVQYALSQLPEAKLKPLFEESQLVKARKAFEKAQAFKPLLIEKALIVAYPDLATNDSYSGTSRRGPAADASFPVNQGND